jgi:hypothetical protein
MSDVPLMLGYLAVIIYIVKGNYGNFYTHMIFKNQQKIKLKV